MGSLIWAQETSHNPGADHGNKFEQLEREFPSPNRYRSASGQPGPLYWQQQVDYKINTFLDTGNQRIEGEETIVYHNQSPDTLRYIWLLLDENEHLPQSTKHASQTSSASDFTKETLQQLLQPDDKSYGIQIREITNTSGHIRSWAL